MQNIPNIPGIPNIPAIPSIDEIIKKIISQVMPSIFPSSSGGKANAFLKIEGIQGESRDETHQGEIEVLDFHWSVAQPKSAAASSAGATTTERAHFGDLTVYKSVDRATPDLAYACAAGKHLSKARLQLCRAGGDNEAYMEYTLTDVIITSVRTGGRGYGERLPLEEVSLSYAMIEWKYLQTEVETGKAAGSLVKGWNLKSNKG